MPADSSNLSGWAGELIDLYGLSGVTTGSVVVWLETNVGSLNLALHSEYATVSGSGIVDITGGLMGDMEMDIYSQMYECYIYKKKSVQAAQLGFNDWIQLDGDQQGGIRKVSKTELAKELRNASRDCNKDLDKQILWYRRNGGPNPEGMPRQIIPVNVAPETSPFIVISGDYSGPP
jgi:hypothetical protein